MDISILYTHTKCGDGERTTKDAGVGGKAGGKARKVGWWRLGGKSARNGLGKHKEGEGRYMGRGEGR